MSKYGRVKNLRLVRDIGNFSITIIQSEVDDIGASLIFV